jgi:hypothetical protein
MASQVRNEELERFGFAIERNAIDETWRARLLALLDSGFGAGEVRHRSGAVFAARGLLSHVPALRAALDASGLSELASFHLGGDAVAIDALFFDKRSAVNWTVPGHQDRSMPLDGEPGTVRRVKNGVAYTEPPREVLASLLALRLHFDDCDGTTRTSARDPLQPAG